MIKIKSTSTWYDVDATVVVRDNESGSIIIKSFSGEGFDTKSVRTIKSKIKSNYENDENANLTVIAVENVAVEKRTHTFVYEIDCDTSRLAELAEAAGITVKSTEA